MPEIWFYHLTRQPLERALPALLERTVGRGWRAVVETLDDEHVQALDELLWTYSDESFLAHGCARDGDPDLQPIWLTSGPDNPNGAHIRFFVGAAVSKLCASTDHERIAAVFEAADEEQVQAAREQWRKLRDEGATLAYWRQEDDGRWTKQF